MFKPFLNVYLGGRGKLVSDTGCFGGHRRTAIHGSLRHTTTTDGGSADVAGADICPPIHGHKKTRSS
jgi:hypothetical protein